MRLALSMKGKGQGNVRVRIREKTLRSGERLQRRTCTQLKRQLRTVESAADRLERLRIQIEKRTLPSAENRRS